MCGETNKRAASQAAEQSSTAAAVCSSSRETVQGRHRRRHLQAAGTMSGTAGETVGLLTVSAGLQDHTARKKSAVCAVPKKQRKNDLFSRGLDLCFLSRCL